MQFPDPLIHGTLLRRYKRFLADIQLDDGRERSAAIGTIYQRALSRSPTRQELRLGLQYLAGQQRLIASESQATEADKDPAFLALAEYCQVILNLDEFLYVE